MTRAPRSRRPRLLLVAGLLAAVAVLAAGCGGESRGDEDTAVTLLEPEYERNDEVTETTEPADPVDREAVEQSTETEQVPLIGSETPQGAMEQLYGAWRSGDRDNALVVAETPAVDGIWQAPEGDYALYRGCDTGEFDTTGCLYRGDPGTIQFEMENRDGRWIVVMATFSPA